MKNKIIPYNPKLREFARELRNNSTKAEIRLWNSLKQKKLGVQFYRQVPLYEFIVDFYCKSLKLAIEVDGSIHDFQFQYDGNRQNILEKKFGIEFLRFSNEDIFNRKFEVLKTIETKIYDLST